MADSSIPLTPATAPVQSLDSESLGGGLERERVQITGNVLAEIARVLAANPVLADYGLVTRNIPAALSTSDLTGAVISFSSLETANTIVAGVALQTIRVFKMFLVTSVACTIVFQDGGSAVTGVITLSAGGSIVLDFDTRPWFITTAGNNFTANLTSSGTPQVSGRIYYTQSA